MLLKLDENLGRSHVELLRNAGRQADRVYDEGLSGETDSTVWEQVCAEGRFFITLDLDFADVRRYPPAHWPALTRPCKVEFGGPGHKVRSARWRPGALTPCSIG